MWYVWIYIKYISKDSILCSNANVFRIFLISEMNRV